MIKLKPINGLRPCFLLLQNVKFLSSCRKLFTKNFDFILYITGILYYTYIPALSHNFKT